MDAIRYSKDTVDASFKNSFFFNVNGFCQFFSFSILSTSVDNLLFKTNLDTKYSFIGCSLYLIFGELFIEKGAQKSSNPKPLKSNDRKKKNKIFWKIIRIKGFYHDKYYQLFASYNTMIYVFIFRICVKFIRSTTVIST